MAAVDIQSSENNDNKINNHIEENNRSDNKIRSSENADICANGNNEEDESEAEHQAVNHVVKKILDSKMGKNGTRFFKVRWGDTWEPEQNLYGCMEMVNEFLEKRKKEKDKKYDGEEEESLLKGGYCLREKNYINKKKRKIGSAKRLPSTLHKRQKRRRQLHQNQSSSEEGPGTINSGQSDHSDEGSSDSQPYGIHSPQIVVKKMCTKKRLTEKRKKLNNNLFNGIDDSDDDENEPLSKHVSHMESVNDAEDTIPQATDSPSIPQVADLVEDIAPTDVTLADVSTTVTSTVTTVTSAVSTFTVTTTPSIAKTMETCSTDISSWQRSNNTTKRQPILLEDDSDEENPLKVEEVKVKEEPVSAEESEKEEELFKRAAKLKASFVIRKLCETGEIFSADESGDESDVDESYCPDSPFSTNKNLSPVRIRQEEHAVVIGLSKLSPNTGENLPNDFNKITPTTEALMPGVPINIRVPNLIRMSMGIPPFHCNQSGIDINNSSAFVNRTSSPYVITPIVSHKQPIRTQHRNLIQPVPLDFIPPSHFTFNDMSTTKPADKNFTIPSRPCIHYKKQVENEKNIQNSPSGVHRTNPIVIDIKNVSTTIKPIQDDEDDVICIDTSIIQPTFDHIKKSEINANSTFKTYPPIFPPSFNHTRTKPPADLLNKKIEIPLQLNIPIKYLPDPYVQDMMNRILFHVKKYIELFRLEPGVLPDLVRGLIAEGVVLTIKESYKLDKAEPNFVEAQVNDLMQIALKELRYEKLMVLLYNYAVPNVALNRSLSNDNVVSHTNVTIVPPKPPAIPVTSINTETQTSKVPIVSTVRTIVPPLMGRGPLPMGVPPMGMFLPPPFPMRLPPPGFAHPLPFFPHPRMDEMRVPFNLMVPRSVTRGNIDPVSSGMHSVISQLHPANRLPYPSNRLPNSVISEMHPANRLPHPVISDLHSANRLLNPVYTSQTIRATNSTSLAITSGIVVPSMNMSVSPPPLTIINSLPGIGIECSTSLPCNITNVRSLKHTQPDSEPLVESIDINDDDLTRNKDYVNISTPGSPVSYDSTTSENMSTLNSQSVTPNVKTVLGPHRFYRPPKTPLSESRSLPNVSIQPSDVTTKEQLNLVKRGNDQIRYKDLVNQKFTAKPVTFDDLHKVIDLTEGEASIVALDQSDKDDKSDEDKGDKDETS